MCSRDESIVDEGLINLDGDVTRDGECQLATATGSEIENGFRDAARKMRGWISLAKALLVFLDTFQEGHRPESAYAQTL